MTTPSHTCQTQVEEQKHKQAMRIGIEWICIREYKRVTGSPSDVEAWDSKCQQAWLDFEQGKSNHAQIMELASSDEQKFAQITYFLYDQKLKWPGWNNDACTMDWSGYACFCNWAAHKTYDQLKALKLAPPDQLKYDCPPEVRNDLGSRNW